MKRLWITLIIIFVTIISMMAFGQKSQQDSRQAARQEAMRLREELHRRLLNHLFHGTGTTDDVFKDMDSLFEDVMSDMGEDFSSGGSKNYEMTWTESKEGRSLLLSPQDKNQKLEINVEQGMVSIKGNNQVKTPNGTSISSFSHSYSVPGDCDWTRVKILEKEGKIVLSFPYKSLDSAPKSPKPEEKNLDRTPLPPAGQEVTI